MMERMSIYDIISGAADQLSLYAEAMAGAYYQKTGIDPRECMLVQKTDWTDDGLKMYWTFERRPTGTRPWDVSVSKEIPFMVAKSPADYDKMRYTGKKIIGDVVQEVLQQFVDHFLEGCEVRVYTHEGLDEFGLDVHIG